MAAIVQYTTALVINDAKFKEPIFIMSSAFCLFIYFSFYNFVIIIVAV